MLKSNGLETPAVRTTAELPGLIATPLRRWLLVVPALPWIRSLPPPKAKEEELVALLTIFVAGAPAWAKSSSRAPPAMFVLPLYVSAAVSTSVPVPVLVRLPGPDSEPVSTRT